MNTNSYILTSKETASFDVYSIRSEGTKNVLIFECEADAERYVIMLKEDETYVVGDEFRLDVTEVPLDMVLEVLATKGYNYIYVKSDDLFIPPS